MIIIWLRIIQVAILCMRNFICGIRNLFQMYFTNMQWCFSPCSWIKSYEVKTFFEYNVFQLRNKLFSVYLFHFYSIFKESISSSRIYLISENNALHFKIHNDSTYLYRSALFFLNYLECLSEIPYVNRNFFLIL